MNYYLKQNFFIGIATLIANLLWTVFPTSATTISSSHPRLLVTPEKVQLLRNELVLDGDMEQADCNEWGDTGTPTTKEKIEFGGSRRIHIIGGYGDGAGQYLDVEPGIEYEYCISVFLINGKCKGQLYKTGNIKDLYNYDSPTGKWKTFRGRFISKDSTVLFRFYGYDNSGSSEFYVDNVSLAIVKDKVVDGNMEKSDSSDWEDVESPTLREKTDFDGSRRLHVIGNYSYGAGQYIRVEPGKEYKYSVSVYLVSGYCKGQLYQGDKLKDIFNYNTPVNSWQTFTGTYTAGEGNLLFRFYGYDNSGSSEFYIDNVSLTPSSNEVVDNDMELSGCDHWDNMATPDTKEKVDFGGNRRLHVIADHSEGILFYPSFVSGEEYEYSVSVYLVSGRCKAQLYQSNNMKDLYDTSSTGAWQTFSGKFVPNDSSLAMRFYGYDSSGSSEFYIDNISFKRTGNRIIDNDMEAEDCSAWIDFGAPVTKEKISFDGSRRLHVVGGYVNGAGQYLDFKPGVEYEYSISVYLVSGCCKGQLYQNSNIEDVFNFSSPTGSWQTFTGSFIPDEGTLYLRFYGYDSSGNSEFYIDNVSFKTSDGSNDLNLPLGGPLYEYVNDVVLLQTPYNFAHNTYMSARMRSLAFVAMLNDDEDLIDDAIDFALAVAGREADEGATEDVNESGKDTPQRERLLSMAYAYDFLHDKLSSTEKETLRASMVAHMDELDHFVNSPCYTGGHSRYGNVTILAALLALYNEYGSDTTYCNSLLSDVIDNWEDGYNPFQQWVNHYGGYHMGWYYGASYNTIEPYLLWKSATGETWNESSRDDLAFFYIYGLRGDNTYPVAGDAWSMGIDPYQADICTISAYLGNSYAMDFIQKHSLNSTGSGYLWRLLFTEDNSSPLYSNITNLPKARNFGRSGYVVAKDKWEDATATHLTFKCSSFYSLNHHHKDQNSMTVHYKGPLLIDSGCYDSYGSSHWINYYTRTIAHNTLVVYDSSEIFKYKNQVVSNDGGQKFFGDNLEEPETLAEAQSSQYSLDGITSFSQTSTQCYIKGDASKAYNSSKLDTYTREVTMVYEDSQNNNKPTITVNDHIVLNRTLIPKILFHSETEPTLDTQNKKIYIENSNGGGVEIEVISPSNVNFTIVGGTDQEFWVNGTNWAPSELLNTEPGAWRVEVGTSSAVSSADFQFKLRIYDIQ
jgi:hypothetical protein